MRGASEVPAIPEDDRLWWFLFVLRTCGKSGADANGDPEEWVAAFCDDVEPTDTFNRACGLGFATCTHNSLFDTSTVWLTDKGKAWLVARAARPVDTGRDRALEEIAVKLNMDADLETERVEKKRIGSIGRTSGLWAALKLRMAAIEVRALANPENGRG